MAAHYLTTTALYGALHKVPLVWNASFYRKQSDDSCKNNHVKLVPMLFTDKAALIVVGAVTGPYLWPIYLYKDVALIERKVRGIPAEDLDVGTSKKLVDFWFE